jgi:hypothetical protein
MSNQVWTDRVGANLGGATRTLVTTISSLSGKGSIRGFAFVFIYDFLLNAFGKGCGIGCFVRDIVGSHLRTNVVGLALKHSEHSKHEHYVLSRDSLCIYAGTKIPHTICSCLPGGHVSRVQNR